MLYLDRNKFEAILTQKGLSINRLASACGISRQSLYNMLDITTIFKSSFEKVVKELNIDYKELVREASRADEILKKAPGRIKRAVLELSNFAEAYNAHLLLIENINSVKYGRRAEWSFGVYFPEKDKHPELQALRQELVEATTPYTISITNLNRTPYWYLKSIEAAALAIGGDLTIGDILGRKA